MNAFSSNQLEYIPCKHLKYECLIKSAIVRIRLRFDKLIKFYHFYRK